jgi:hypothetical protein
MKFGLSPSLEFGIVKSTGTPKIRISLYNLEPTVRNLQKTLSPQNPSLRLSLMSLVTDRISIKNLKKSRKEEEKRSRKQGSDEEQGITFKGLNSFRFRNERCVLQRVLFDILFF